MDVVGTGKGMGFAGKIKRHNYSRGPETHGSKSHREPGSIGPMISRWRRGKVYKGKNSLTNGWLQSYRTTLIRCES